MKRKAIPARVRFEVLKRDSFTCQYCGAKAPDVLLEVDHIHPVAKDGSDEMLNLVVSCKGCNSGKSDKLLSDDSAIEKHRRQLEELQQRREQLDLMMEWKTGLLAAKEDEVEQVHSYWKKLCVSWCMSPSGMDTLKKTVRKHGAIATMEAMDAATSYLRTGEDGKLTQESVRDASHYYPRIANMQKENEKNPHLKDLFYVRAIVRRSFTYCNERDALALLKEAHAAGASFDHLKDVARAARSWTAWKASMLDSIRELNGGE